MAVLLCRQAMRRVAIFLLFGAIFEVDLPASCFAEDKPPLAATKSDPYADFIAEAAQRFEIPEIWIRAVLHAESNGDSRALSAKGAVGLMQIMPTAWDEIRARHLLGTDPYDPHDNIIAGAAYLRQLYDRYGSPGFLAAYNAGPDRYGEHLATGKPLPAETRRYVAVLSALIGSTSTFAKQDNEGTSAPRWATAPIFAGQMRARIDAGQSRTNDTTAAVPEQPAADAAIADKPAAESLFVVRPTTGTDR